MKKHVTSVNLESFRRRYKRSGRKGKGKLLTQLCDLYQYNRKYLLQFFNGLTGRKYARPGAPVKYKPTEELLTPIRRMWLASGQLCSKRLKVAIVSWLPSYEDSYGFVSCEVKQKLLAISTGTLDKLLKPYRAKYKRRGLSGTRPGYLLKNQIPIKKA